MMKKFIIFCITLLLLVIIIHISFFAFVNIKGKDIFLSNIEEKLGSKASLDAFSLKFPFEIELTGFNCGDISFANAKVFLIFPNPFKFRLTFSDVLVEDLSIRITKDDAGTHVISKLKEEPVDSPKESKKGIEPKAYKQKSSKPVPFTIKNFYAKNSTLEYIDFKKEEPMRVAIKDADLYIKNLNFPEFSKLYINVVASLQTDVGEAKKSLDIDGWADYHRKDMDMTFTLNSVNYNLFSKFYSSSWQPQNLGIKDTYLSFESTLISQGNDLLIDSELSIDKIAFIEGLEDTSRQDLLRTIIAFIKGNKEKASLRFKIKTKMDSPSLDFSSIKKAMRGSIPIAPKIIADQIISKTKKAVSSGKEEAKEVTEDVKKIAVDKPLEIIKETIESIKDIFESSKE